MKTAFLIALCIAVATCQTTSRKPATTQPSLDKLLSAAFDSLKSAKLTNGTIVILQRILSSYQSECEYEPPLPSSDFPGSLPPTVQPSQLPDVSLPSGVTRKLTTVKTTTIKTTTTRRPNDEAILLMQYARNCRLSASTFALVKTLSTPSDVPTAVKTLITALTAQVPDLQLILALNTLVSAQLTPASADAINNALMALQVLSSCEYRIPPTTSFDVTTDVPPSPSQLPDVSLPSGVTRKLTTTKRTTTKRPVTTRGPNGNVLALIDYLNHCEMEPYVAYLLTNLTGSKPEVALSVKNCKLRFAAPKNPEELLYKIISKFQYADLPTNSSSFFLGVYDALKATCNYEPVETTEAPNLPTTNDIVDQLFQISIYDLLETFGVEQTTFLFEQVLSLKSDRLNSKLYLQNMRGVLISYPPSVGAISDFTNLVFTVLAQYDDEFTTTEAEESEVIAMTIDNIVTLMYECNLNWEVVTRLQVLITNLQSTGLISPVERRFLDYLISLGGDFKRPTTIKTTTKRTTTVKTTRPTTPSQQMRIFEALSYVNGTNFTNSTYYYINNVIVAFAQCLYPASTTRKSTVSPKSTKAPTFKPTTPTSPPLDLNDTLAEFHSNIGTFLVSVDQLPEAEQVYDIIHAYLEFFNAYLSDGYPDMDLLKDLWLKLRLLDANFEVFEDVEGAEDAIKYLANAIKYVLKYLDSYNLDDHGRPDEFNFLMNALANCPLTASRVWAIVDLTTSLLNDSLIDPEMAALVFNVTNQKTYSKPTTKPPTTTKTTTTKTTTTKTTTTKPPTTTKSTTTKSTTPSPALMAALEVLNKTLAANLTANTSLLVANALAAFGPECTNKNLEALSLVIASLSQIFSATTGANATNLITTLITGDNSTAAINSFIANSNGIDSSLVEAFIDSIANSVTQIQVGLLINSLAYCTITPDAVSALTILANDLLNNQIITSTEYNTFINFFGSS